MAPVLAYYHKHLRTNQSETLPIVCVDIIQVPTPGKAQALHWQLVQKPLPHFTPASTTISRFQIAYCSLAITITLGFNIFFMLKGLDLKILDGIVVPLLFLYILAVQLIISKCRQRHSPVLGV